MRTFSILSLFTALCLFMLASSAPLEERATTYWVSNIKRQGTVAFGTSGYTVYRNVKDYGAKGDGTTDDTAAINMAISTGTRCGNGCDSSTITPALVYFPPGTYLVSAPLIQYYYTQFVGDAVSIPTLKASSTFQGIGVIDSDPYTSTGQWYKNQNNFFRQVRNFKIDLTALPYSTGTGIHWQVAQGTSLQNIVFNMRTDGGTSNTQQGIFMDNGSGGFMSDLTFNGGKYGAFFGNQQFTTRNMTFNNCKTAIYMNWNWLWTLHGIKINSCGVGIDMSSGGASAQSAGSTLLIDSAMTNTPVGILTAYSTSKSPNGTLILDNVDFSENVPVAVKNSASSATILAGNQKIASWFQGHRYIGASSLTTVQGTQTAPYKPPVLLNSAGQFFTRSKPQYETLPASAFISVKSNGAKGDGVTDDTAAIQAIFNSASTSSVVYFDHGAYLVTSTIKVPKNIRITGEIWPLIMAGGTSAFKDINNPKPVFQVGQPGDVGSVELTDLVFETKGAQPGAIMMEWNLKQAAQGSSGMWDVHTRIGGSAGTGLQASSCKYDPAQTAVDAACEGSFLMLHVNDAASLYMENTWFWVADHELDQAGHANVTVYNGRGVLVTAAEGPVWMWGTAAEHSQRYNYNVARAANVFMGAAQAETAYYQSNPNAIAPFPLNAAYDDPNFDDICTNTGRCPKTFGLMVQDSTNVLVYGAGLYSFFDNYDETCLATESCQDYMVDISNSTGVNLYGLSTKAATEMVRVDGKSGAQQSYNRDNFCSTVALFRQTN